MRKKVQEKKPAKPAVAEKIETVDSASRVVLVLRHAKAQPKSGKPDFNRRLTKQGREDAALVGKKIAREFGRVDFVLTSAAPRALATATAAAAAAGIPRDKIRSYKLLYAAAADKWVARMRRLPDDAKTVLLVGHNPECEDLIALLGGARVEMKKSALAALRFAGRWNEIGPASCRLRNHFPAGKPTRKSNVPPQNRELSWLSFNDRVLQEADDSRVPPLDRLLFLGIVSSNLDEFFRVRVGSLEHILRRAKGRKHHKETREVLTAVQQRASRLQRRLEHTLTNICRLLAERHRSPTGRGARTHRRRARLLPLVLRFARAHRHDDFDELGIGNHRPRVGDRFGLFGRDDERARQIVLCAVAAADRSQQPLRRIAARGRRRQKTPARGLAGRRHPASRCPIFSGNSDSSASRRTPSN